MRTLKFYEEYSNKYEYYIFDDSSVMAFDRLSELHDIISSDFPGKPIFVEQNNVFGKYVITLSVCDDKSNPINEDYVKNSDSLPL